MSVHIYRSTADAENHLYPDSPEFERSIECRVGCNGWQECREDAHTAHGYHGVNDGPYESDEDAPWYDEEEFEFHGVVHTWNGHGYGWTVPYEGCVVAANDYDEPYGPDTRRDGSWLVADDWNDTDVSLTVVHEVEDERAIPGTPVRVEGKVSALTDAPSATMVASYFRASGVDYEYAEEHTKHSRRVGEWSAAALSSESILIASQAGVPPMYAFAADVYASMFAVGTVRGAIVVDLHEAGVAIEYIQAAQAFLVAPSVLLEAWAGGVPLEYLEQLSEAPVAP